MNCLVDNIGTVTDCLGADHEALCQRVFKTSLMDWLIAGGCRVMYHNEIVAIEAHNELSDAQRIAINRQLKYETIYVIRAAIRGTYRTVEKFRPIKSIPKEVLS